MSASRRGRAHQHLTTAVSMYREMDMSHWPEQTEAEIKALFPMNLR